MLSERTGLSLADVKAEIDELQRTSRTRLKYLRALLRALEAEHAEAEKPGPPRK